MYKMPRVVLHSLDRSEPILPLRVPSAGIVHLWERREQTAKALHDAQVVSCIARDIGSHPDCYLQWFVQWFVLMHQLTPTHGCTNFSVWPPPQQPLKVINTHPPFPGFDYYLLAANSSFTTYETRTQIGEASRLEYLKIILYQYSL